VGFFSFPTPRSAALRTGRISDGVDAYATQETDEPRIAAKRIETGPQEPRGLKRPAAPRSSQSIA
jgi:hypothetical protein